LLNVIKVFRKCPGIAITLSLLRQHMGPPVAHRIPMFGTEEEFSQESVADQSMASPGNRVEACQYRPGEQLRKAADTTQTTLLPVFMSADVCTPTVHDEHGHISDCSTSDTDSPHVKQSLRRPDSSLGSKSEFDVLEFPSVGSERHHAGNCKPCVFMHKADGCSSGHECSFCHLCGPGEKELRKKMGRMAVESLKNSPILPSQPSLTGGRVNGWIGGALQTPPASSLPLTEPKDIPPTMGSTGHEFGRCKPCAFVHTKGCTRGYDCEFCHLCAPGERELRRKEKRTGVRSFRTWS